MTFQEMIQIYGSIITTIGIFLGALKYILSSKIMPIEREIVDLKNKNKELEIELDALKAVLFDDVKEISQGNFEFRLKYEGGVKDIKLLLAESFVTKDQLEKEIGEIKRSIDLHYDLKMLLDNLKGNKK